jgi:hypothetical protein
MSTTLASLLPDLAGRLEETDPNSPVFWSLIDEFLPALVDAQFEAALITGTVQAVNIPVKLAAGTTYFSLQNNTTIGIPAGVIAALRLRLPWPIRKTTLAGLDAMVPNWQQAAPGTTVQAWGPLGVSSFFIYPQLASPQQCVMDFILSPVTSPRPYNTAIPIPFQEEFTDAFAMYAAVMLRSKELGLELEAASTVLDEYMSQMKDLSMFQNRLDQLVLTNTYGARATVQRREVV